MRTTTLRLCLLAGAAAACGHAQARLDVGGALAARAALPDRIGVVAGAKQPESNGVLDDAHAPHCAAHAMPPASDGMANQDSTAEARWCAGPASCAAHAASVPAAPPQEGATTPASASWNAVDSATLAQARAGFGAPDGLIVSLGIDKLVSINGNVVAHTSFQIADLASISGEELAQTRAALSSLKLVQNGGDNIYLANLSPMTGTVIQNSLDQQWIRSETVINASVNSTDLLKTLNFQSSLGAALANAVGAH